MAPSDRPGVCYELRSRCQALLAGAARATHSGNKPMSMKDIQAEVNAVRRARKSRADA